VNAAELVLSYASQVVSHHQTLGGLAVCLSLCVCSVTRLAGGTPPPRIRFKECDFLAWASNAFCVPPMLTLFCVFPLWGDMLFCMLVL
jgi:hypothetical protein